ncbi:AraC family transcriptional regulator [Mycobacterium sp. CBMA 234]|uniref:helix-turn-helix domain-containing protein n=1 Tax=Mycolicibacterium sp. CBMA 234 TaxID=1918495 RepID=UPI0012DE004A|nr:AraC family transcriptional regulator [Mycolicibacterium sp. CBMA 234]MUL66896.1 AraC family transcriptional regulator [Mycolicibacterium sp. CBMA 234]
MAAWKNPTTTPRLGVVGRANTGSVFDLQQWPPSAEAAEWVENFWSVTWDLSNAEPFQSTVIPFPALHLTHEWGTDDVRHGHRLPATLVHGVVEQVFTNTLSATGAVVGARFRPGGFAARFGRDAGALTGRVLPVDDELLGAPMAFADDIEQAAAAMDDAIGDHPGSDPTYRELLALLDRVSADAQLHRVEQVMAQSPWSERTTQRIFRRYVGVPVKWVLCRYRLQHAALQIETVPDLDFAALAVQLGWYDQAHFINDFRAMLGCTPGEYAGRHRG